MSQQLRYSLSTDRRRRFGTFSKSNEPYSSYKYCENYFSSQPPPPPPSSSSRPAKPTVTASTVLSHAAGDFPSTSVTASSGVESENWHEAASAGTCASGGQSSSSTVYSMVNHLVSPNDTPLTVNELIQTQLRSSVLPYPPRRDPLFTLQRNVAYVEKQHDEISQDTETDDNDYFSSLSSPESYDDRQEQLPRQQRQSRFSLPARPARSWKNPSIQRRDEPPYKNERNIGREGQQFRRQTRYPLPARHASGSQNSSVRRREKPPNRAGLSVVRGVVQDENQQPPQYRFNNVMDNGNQESNDSSGVQKLQKKLQAERRKNKYLYNESQNYKTKYEALQAMHDSTIMIPMTMKK